MIDHNNSETGKYISIDKNIVKEYNVFRKAINKKYLCNAPFGNILFNINGKAYACCFNSSYPYGEYPNQIVKNIFFGSEREMLKKHIINYDFELGCILCKQAINQKTFNVVNAQFFDNINPNDKFPSKIEFELSNTCNLECIMCNYNSSSSICKNREKLTKIKSPYDDNFVSELEKYIPNLKNTTFSGGEPFLIDIYYKIWDKIIEINPNCEIVVQTNGTILNERIKRLLEKGRFNINVSLDSLRKESYEKIRKNAKFDNTLYNVKYFINYCKRNNTLFHLTPCVLRQNWNELEDIIKFANSYEVNVIFKTVYSPINVSLFSNSKIMLNYIHYKLSKLKFPENTDYEKANKEVFDAVLFQIKHLFNNNKLKEQWFNHDVEYKMNIILNKIQNHKETNIDKNPIIRFKNYFNILLENFFHKDIVKRVAEKKYKTTINIQEKKLKILFNSFIKDYRAKNRIKINFYEIFKTNDLEQKLKIEIILKEFFLNEMITYISLYEDSLGNLNIGTIKLLIDNKLCAIRELSGQNVFIDILVTLYSKIPISYITKRFETFNINEFIDIYHKLKQNNFYK